MPTKATVTVEGSAGGSSPKALRLSSTFAPLPAKLVEMIQSGQYVKMKDLLAEDVCRVGSTNTIGTLMFKISHLRCEVKTYWEMGMVHLWLKWMGDFIGLNGWGFYD